MTFNTHKRGMARNFEEYEYLVFRNRLHSLPGQERHDRAPHLEQALQEALGPGTVGGRLKVEPRKAIPPRTLASRYG